MPRYVVMVDTFGLLLAMTGFCMAFRQGFVRRLIRQPPQPAKNQTAKAGHDDPLTYVLRISGVMIMIFGMVIGGMVTMINLA